MKLLEEMVEIEEFFLKHVFTNIRYGQLLEVSMKDDSDAKIIQEYNVDKIIEDEEILHEEVPRDILIIGILNESLILEEGSTKQEMELLEEWLVEDPSDGYCMDVSSPSVGYVFGPWCQE